MTTFTFSTIAPVDYMLEDVRDNLRERCLNFTGHDYAVLGEVTDFITAAEELASELQIHLRENNDPFRMRDALDTYERARARLAKQLVTWHLETM